MPVSTMLDHSITHALPLDHDPITRHVMAAIGALASYAAFAAWLLNGTPYAVPPLATAAMILLFSMLATYFAVRHANNSLATCCVAAAGFAATWQIMILGYAVHHYGQQAPLIDPILEACDATLGFNWQSYLSFFDARPRLTQLLGVLYQQCSMEMYIAALAAVLWQKQLRLLHMITANFIVLTLVHCCAIVAPAIGPYAFLNLSPADHPNITLITADHLVPEIMRMRDSTTLILPEHPLGLVNFPSYHTAVAVMFGWFFWRTPLRWPALMINVVLGFATIIHGSHYLTDVVAGAALTGLVLAISGRWLAAPAKVLKAGSSSIGEIGNKSINSWSRSIAVDGVPPV